jgi:hypothetical protein
MLEKTHVKSVALNMVAMRASGYGAISICQFAALLAAIVVIAI